MQNTEDRKWLYEQLKDNGYDIGSQEEFEASLDNNEEDAKWYHEQATSLGLEVGNYEDFGSLFRNKPTPEGYTLEEMKATTATPMSEQYSVAPEPSKGQEKFGLDSGIPSITETTKGMVDGRLKMVEKPVEQEQAQVQPVEPLTKLGEGLVQGANNTVARAKYGIAETIIKPVVGTQQDDFGALGRIAQIEAEGKDVAEETKWDAKKAIAPKLATATSLLSKFSPKYDTENPNIDIAGADSYDAEEYARRENEAQYDKVIRKALDEANGDVEKAKLIIATQAGKETHADVLQKAAVKKMAESKPTKGWAWVGEMIPQMALPATGMVLTGVTGIPTFASVLGGVNMGVLTASTAGQAMADARQAGASNSQVWTSGIINGAVELLTEKIPYNRYVGRITDAAKNGAKQALGKAVTEVGSTANKELKDLLSKANKRLDGKLFSGKNIEDYMGDLVAEGISEATAEGLQTIIPIIYENPENYPTFMEILGNALEGAKGGIFMGAFLGGASKAAEHRMNRARRKAQGYVDVAEITTPDGKDEIVEVVRNEQDQPVFYWNGQKIPILDKDVKQRYQFNFEDFERGQFQLEQDEAYENGRTLETPQEMNDAANMLELQAQEVRRLYGLGEDADIDAFLGENPLQRALDVRKTDEEAGQIILNYLNAKYTVDGVVEGAQDRIEEETLKATAIIDSRKSETDGLVHPAKMKVDNRQVYVISGNIALLDDGTINSADSDESIIVMDAATGKREFTTAKDLLSADAALDPEVEKQNVRATISDTISTEVANKLEGVLPFNIGDTYPVMDNDGNAHNVQVVAVDDQNTVQVIMDNEAQPTTVTKDIIQQMSNAYNLNRVAQFEQGRQEEREAEKMKQEAQNVVEPTNVVEQTTEAPAEVVPERVVPTLKDGNPDFNAMDAEMFVDEYVSRYGEDSATKIARKNISNARENIGKIDKKIDDITDPNQMEGLYSQRNALEAQIARYSEILDRLGASEDANESEADQRNRLRNDAGNRITTLFPDGMPNVESFILADIATGNRIRWSDKVTNGVVTSRGLGAELGLSDSKQERTRRLPLIGKDAMTPEEYAESLRERLDAVGIRYDESSLRDAVLGVYQSVDSRKGAWDALENMSKKMQEPQTDMDWEDMQQQMAYNKAQNDDAPALPDMPDLETIEEEVPISEGEYREEVYNRQTTAKQPAEVVETSQSVESNGTQTPSSLIDVSTPKSSESKDTTTEPNAQEAEQKNVVEEYGYNGRSLTTDEAKAVINAMQQNAIVVELLELTPENWIAQFGEDGIIDTPIGNVKMGENQYFKLAQKGREGKLGMIKPTLQYPDIIVEEKSSAKNGQTAERNSSYVFVKAFTNTDGSRNYLFTSVTIRKDGKEVVISNQEKETPRIERLLKEGKLAYISEATLPSESTNSTQGNQSTILGGAILSESKDTTSKPQKQEVDEKISQEEQKVNVNPTDGQKEAGNYKKGHVVVDGFNITIEQPKGSVRSGVDADGKEWSITMNNTYGYIRGTEGVDGDHIDVFLSDNLDNWGGEVFVVDQINTDGSFDEHKVMYGFNSIEEAQQAYLSNYSEGWQGLGVITGISKDEFKKWIASSHRKTKPFAEYKSVKTTEGQAVNTTDSASLVEDVTAIESNVDEKPVNKPKSDKKIEDFGEKIGGARKDVARARLLDTVKLSAKDLESLKDPDKILSRKAIIKYMEEGQMTQNDGISLLALNMATRGKYRKALTMEKYREVALQWERGEDIDVGITEQDIDKYMANMPEVARVKPNARERAIADLERIIMTPYNGYRDTYIALNYPAEYRNLRGTYIYKTAWNDKVVVVSGIDSRRGFVFSTYEQAVAKIKRDFPIVELEKSKAKNAAKDKEDSEGHLNITKDDMGWYRVKSRSIPGNIYLSGRFRTKKDAEAYLEQNKEMLLEREQKMTESLMGSNIGMVEREGVDYRNGQDVTPEDFLNTFGFRGVEFGNWVPQAERQLYLNKTYDAIMDFCNIIGISPKAFSLGGELALAFGARGKSRALAHYEPLKMVINLTRMKGAGSLAHEWFHAFDNYISKRKTGNISDMATARFAAERDEVSRAFYDLVSKMNSMDYTERSKRAGEYWGEVEERAARLLENYIYNELERKSQVSPLLVRKDTLFNEEEIPEEDYVKSAWPYPSARENEEIKPYFDHLFSTLEEKVDEQGNVILFRSPIFGHQTQFADLQSEYDALDKDDTEALNAWRDKKADVVRSYVNWVSDKFGLKCELYVFNGGREEEMRKAYDTMVEKYKAEGIKRIPSYESFKEKVANPKVVATHRKSINFVTFNTSAKDAELDIEQFAETLFHENAHRIAQGMYSKQEFEQIWEDAKKSENHIAKSVEKLYSDKSDAQKGNEFIAKAIGELVRNHKQLFTKFLMGKDDISAEDLVKKLKYSLPLGKLVLTETLNKFKDEYQERVLQGSGSSLLGGSRDGGNIEVSEGDGGRNSRRNRQRESERLRAERGRDVVEAATNLASSLGVKLNVIEDVNEITDSNARRQRAKRGAKAWYDVNTDQVYFIAPNAISIADAQESVLHEVVAHKGLRDVVGRENFKKFLDKVYQSAAPEIRTQIIRLAAQNGWDIREATEEYLASLAEEGFDSRENRTFLQKVRDLFMDMLREAKIAIGYNINDNDMRYMLWRTYQMQKSQGAMAFAEDVLMQQKMGVGNFRTRSMTEEEQIIADAKANGTYLKAPNGKDTNLTPKQWVQVRTKAFKEWFGDWEYSPENASKVVDANGEPKVVYNGSKVQHYLYDGRLRTKGQSATNSKVSFFTDNKDVAGRYGKFINEVFLNIRNPYEIDYNGAGWQGWSGAADGMQRASTDSYADLLANGSVDSILERIIENYGRAEADHLASGKVRNEGVAPDGVIAYEVADPMRSTLYIVRNAEAKDISRNSVTPKGVETFTKLGKASLLFDSQIKSATDNVGTFDSNNDDIRFRTTPAPTQGNNGEEQIRDAFDRKVRSAWYQVKEAMYDNRQSIKEYMRMATQAHGANLPSDDVKHIEGYENPYIAIINKSSVNEKEVKSWEKKYYNRILNALQAMYKNSKNRVKELAQFFGSDSLDDIINNYLQGKHGLERNRDMAVRNALAEMSKATLITKQEAEQMLEQVNEELKNDIITPTEADARRQQIGNMLSTKKFTKEQVKIQTEAWNQRKKAIRENDTMSWAEKQRELDRIATTEFGVDLTAKDYSGLGEVFPNQDGKLQDSIEEAYTAIAEFEDRFDTEELWNAIRAANNSILEKSFRSGIINRATMDSIIDMYDYYIPLRGFEAATTEDVYGYLNNEPKAFSMPVKRANGRASKAEFAIPHILQMAHSAILQGNNNLAKMAFANFAQHYPTDLVKQSNMWIRYNKATGVWEAQYPDIPKNATVEQVGAIIDEHNAQMEELAKSKPKEYRKVTGKMDVPYIMPKGVEHNHQIPFKRNGVDYVLTINGSPRLAYAMNGELEKAPSLLGKGGDAIEDFTRYLSGMYTQYNPDFMVSNALRDGTFVMATVPVRENAKYTWKFYKNYFKNNIAVMTYLFSKYELGELNLNNELEREFANFIKNGGETGYAILKDVEETKKRVSKDIHPSIRSKVMKLIDRLGVLGRGVESSARFAAYLTSREVGRSITRSAYDAKEVSVNFNRKGAGAAFNDLADQTRVGKVVGNVAGLFRITHTFFNAGVQGLAGVAKLLKYNPFKGSAALSASFLLGMIVASLYDDDDEDYYNLTETVRRQNIIIRAGEDYVSIPLAIELRAMYGLGEMAISLMRGKEDVTKQNVAYKIADQILQAFPINILEGNGGFDALLPTAEALVAEVMMNEDWQGVPIYREDKYPTDKFNPEWQMVNNYTGRGYIAASKFLSEISGGDEGKRGAIEINPAVVQHIAEGIFGGPVSFFNKVMASYDMARGKKDFEWRNVPFANRVIKDGGGKAQERAMNREYLNNVARYSQMHESEKDYEKIVNDPNRSEEDREKYRLLLEELKSSPDYERLNAFHKASLKIDKLYREYKASGILEDNMDIITQKKAEANAILEK